MRAEIRVELKADKITETAETLTRRIDERFTQSGLGAIAQTIQMISAEASGRIEELSRPMWSLRLSALGIGVVTFVVLAYLMMGGVDLSHFTRPKTFTNFISVVEPSLGSIVFLTAYVVFLKTIEQRHKERRVLEHLNRLRSLAHVIDMHQLTKDPERLLITGPDTASSPKRELTPFLLGRYLDYSSEMLSLLSKIGALWAQAFPEPRILTAVDEIEMLTSGLSRKIWQKVMVLESVIEALNQSKGPTESSSDVERSDVSMDT